MTSELNAKSKKHASGQWVSFSIAPPIGLSCSHRPTAGDNVPFCFRLNTQHQDLFTMFTAVFHGDFEIPSSIFFLQHSSLLMEIILHLQASLQNAFSPARQEACLKSRLFAEVTPSSPCKQGSRLLWVDSHWKCRKNWLPCRTWCVVA